MEIIMVKALNKVYEYHKKESGIKNSFKNLFHREKLYNEAVRDISFTIEKGEIVGFLGPNGAGKTTTLKLLSGILFPTSGTAEVMGFVPWERKKEFKRRFAVVMAQKNQLWWDLPASDSLILNQHIYEISDSEYKKVVGELTELLDVKHLLAVPVRKLSLGERMKMEIISSLLHRPEVIFLDEPTIGLDLIAQRDLRDFIKYYNRQYKTTIILTSHYMDDIEKLCKRSIIINDGTLVFDGLLSELSDVYKNKKMLKISLHDETTPEQIEQITSLGVLRECNSASITLELNVNELSAGIHFLMDDLKMTDFTIENIPIEDSIIEIYQSIGK